jgi:hypothetical protein
VAIEGVLVGLADARTYQGASAPTGSLPGIGLSSAVDSQSCSEICLILRFRFTHMSFAHPRKDFFLYFGIFNHILRNEIEQKLFSRSGPLASREFDQHDL